MRKKTAFEIAGIVATIISVGTAAWFQDQENRRIEADDQIYARGDELFYAWMDLSSAYLDNNISKEEYLQESRQLDQDISEYLGVMDKHQWRTNALPTRNLMAQVLENIRHEIRALENE